MIALLRALLAMLGFILFAGLSCTAAAQEVTTDDIACMKGKAGIGKTCVRYPIDVFEDFKWTQDLQVRYVQKRTLDRKTGKEVVLWGTADREAKRTYIRPQCEDVMPVTTLSTVVCAHDGDLDLLGVRGGTRNSFQDVLPIDHAEWRYHPDFTLAVPVEGGLIVREPDQYTMYVIDGMNSRYVAFTDLAFLASSGKQTAAIPTALTVTPGPGFSGQPVLLPVGRDGNVARPASPWIKGVIDIDPKPSFITPAAVVEGEDGALRYVGAETIDAALSPDTASKPGYRGLARETDAAGRLHVLGLTDTGTWVNLYNRGLDIYPGIPEGETVEEALGYKRQVEAVKSAEREGAYRLAAQEREARKKAEAEASAAGLAEDQRVYAAVQKCFSGLVQAYQDGRWNQIDQASRLWMLRAEAWERRFGWRSHGDPGSCVDHYQPGQKDYPMSEWTLIQYAPVEDARAAYEAEPNAAVKQAYLARWAYSKTFPADVAESARKWAMGVIYSPNRDPIDREQAGDIIHAAALKGDEGAQFSIAMQLSRRFPDFSLKRLVEMGHRGAIEHQQLIDSATRSWETSEAQTGPSTSQIIQNFIELADYCRAVPGDPKCSSFCRSNPAAWSCTDHSVNWNK